jgi:hypothetical protein
VFENRVLRRIIGGGYLEENYITMSSKYYKGNKVKEDEMRGACSVHGGRAGFSGDRAERPLREASNWGS